MFTAAGCVTTTELCTLRANMAMESTTTNFTDCSMMTSSSDCSVARRLCAKEPMMSWLQHIVQLGTFTMLAVPF